MPDDVEKVDPEHIRAFLAAQREGRRRRALRSTTGTCTSTSSAGTGWMRVIDSHPAAGRFGLSHGVRMACTRNPEARLSGCTGGWQAGLVPAGPGRRVHAPGAGAGWPCGHCNVPPRHAQGSRTEVRLGGPRAQHLSHQPHACTTSARSISIRTTQNHAAHVRSLHK